MKYRMTNKELIIEIASIIAVLATVLVLKSVLSRAVFLLLCFSVFVLALILDAWLWTNKKLDSLLLLSGLTTVAFIAVTMLIYTAKDYTFVFGKNPFWAVALTVALLIGFGVMAIAYRFMRLPAAVLSHEKSREKKKSKGPLIGMLLIILLLATIFSYFILESLIEHGNYIFDDGGRQTVSARILEKDHVRRRKGRDDYFFTVEIEGKTVDLDVPSGEYHAHSVGDRYTFDRYEGAFGEPFYMAEEE